LFIQMKIWKTVGAWSIWAEKKNMNSDNSVYKIFTNGFVGMFDCEFPLEKTFWEMNLQIPLPTHRKPCQIEWKIFIQMTGTDSMNW
jgi:hypothetical protein